MNCYASPISAQKLTSPTASPSFRTASPTVGHHQPRREAFAFSPYLRRQANTASPVVTSSPSVKVSPVGAPMSPFAGASPTTRTGLKCFNTVQKDSSSNGSAGSGGDKASAMIAVPSTGSGGDGTSNSFAPPPPGPTFGSPAFNPRDVPVPAWAGAPSAISFSRECPVNEGSRILSLNAVKDDVRPPVPPPKNKLELPALLSQPKQLVTGDDEISPGKVGIFVRGEKGHGLSPARTPKAVSRQTSTKSQKEIDPFTTVKIESVENLRETPRARTVGTRQHRQDTNCTPPPICGTNRQSPTRRHQPRTGGTGRTSPGPTGSIAPLSFQKTRRPSLSKKGETSPGGKAPAIKETLADDRKVRQLAYEWFKQMDRDSNGTLCFDELMEGMRHMNKNLGVGQFRERDIARFMRRFDTNGDGILCQSEFLQVYRYLLLAKLNEEEPAPFCRDLFLGRRMGHPSDHYEILCTVGKGSFGIVKKVLCKESRTTRVLKTVDKEAALKSGLPPKVVMEEIDKLKALDHPAVLRLFEYYVDSQDLHLITDHLQGGELCKAVEDAHKNDQPLEENWIRSIFYQVCEGVAYCHGKGVMHRDLKLENIMLNTLDPPEAIIIDVGLAELFPPNRADSHRSSAPTGSIPTMAPEVLMQSSTYKCDVWSLGCCLFGMVCKTPIWFKRSSGDLEAYPYPFSPPQDDSRPQLEEYLRRQKAGPDLSNTWCKREAPSARDLISRMLTFSVEVRPNMKQVLMHPWLRRTLEECSTPTFDASQIDSMIGFQRSSALEEAVLLNVASQLPLKELTDFRDLFRYVDSDKDGRLDSQELAEAFVQAGLDHHCAQDAAKKLARLGTVEFSRFVAGLLPSKPELLLPYLRDAFNRLDTDGDGYVSFSELRGLLEKTSLKNTKISQTVVSMFEALGGCQRISFEALAQHVNDICA